MSVRRAGVRALNDTRRGVYTQIDFHIYIYSYSIRRTHQSAVKKNSSLAFAHVRRVRAHNMHRDFSAASAGIVHLVQVCETETDNLAVIQSAAIIIRGEREKERELQTTSDE